MKKQLAIFGLIILITSVVVLSGCFSPSGFVKNIGFRETFEVSPGTIINCYNYIQGDILIIGGSSTNYTDINGLKAARTDSVNYADITIDATTINNTMTIKMEYKGNKELVALKNLIIRVPDYVEIGDIFASDGNIEISNVSGHIDATTNNGYIELFDVSGYIQSLTSNVPTSYILGWFLTQPSRNTTIITNDDTYIRIKPGLNADIEMKAINGNISIADIEVFANESSDNYLKGKIGTGGFLIYVESTNGKISLYKN